MKVDKIFSTENIARRIAKTLQSGKPIKAFHDAFLNSSRMRAALKKSDWVRMKSMNARKGPGIWRRLG